MTVRQFGSKFRVAATATLLVSISIFTSILTPTLRASDLRVSDLCASDLWAGDDRQANGGPAKTSATPQDEPSKIERLRQKLKKPGAEGQKERETAVERLLAMADPEAHRVLSQTLERDEDPDAVRMLIVQALERHLLGTDAQQFDGAGTDLRLQIFTLYLGSLSDWWRNVASAQSVALRIAARDALKEVPVREFERSATLLLDRGIVNAPALFRCIADLQNIYLGQVLAQHVEDKDAAVRTAARASLRLLTFRDLDFQTEAEFVAWFAKNSNLTYVDLAERAGRMAAVRLDEVRKQIEQERVARTRDVIRAHASPLAGIHWAEIQKKALVSDPVLLDAAMTALRESLGGRMPLDGSSARQRFCRALLERWKQTPVAEAARRASLLEVAAYTARPDDAELAGEIQAGLLAQLKGGAVDQQVAALRGLQRFPSVESRAVIVQYARSKVGLGAEAMLRIETAIDTLASRATPRWLAPSASDADKGEWIEFIRSICVRPDLARLREKTLTLALTEDSKNVKVPEVFDLLLELAQDTKQDSQFRSTCVISLQGWDYPAGADKRVLLLHKLLEDGEPQLRKHAAQSLGMLVKSDDDRREAWLSATIIVLRGRLAVEPTQSVMDAFADCMIVCGSEPKMPAKAIGALNHVLAELGSPSVATEHKFRLKRLVRALAAIAGDEDAANGPWLGATNHLLALKERDRLRHLLAGRHAALEMAGGVTDDDVGVASRSRKAMHVLISTALLKKADKLWSSSDDLRAEANAVWVAFNALDGVADEKASTDGVVYRMLRLEVALVGNHFRKVVDSANNWLASDPNPAAPAGAASKPLTPTQKDHMRLLAAEAQLGLQKPDLAAKLLNERDPQARLDARARVVYEKTAVALVTANDASKALDLFDRVRNATPVEDPAFRERLIAWATTRLLVDPTQKSKVWADVQKHAPLFDGQDCPKVLREAFEGLRDG